jgi:hypothetical protein
VFKIPHQNAPDGEVNPLAMRNLRAVFADDAVNAAANRAKAQQGDCKVFHVSSYVCLIKRDTKRYFIFLCASALRAATRYLFNHSVC